MENVLIAVLCIALMIFAGLAIAQFLLSSQDEVATAWKEMEDTSSQISRTDISVLDTSVTNGGGNIEQVLANTGAVKLTDFDKWDVILQYYDTGDTYRIERMAYTSAAPADNQWTVEGIYLDAGSKTAEVFDSGIFNPDEEIILEMRVNPAVGSPTANMSTVSTSNGISATAIFNRPDTG